MRPLLLQTVFCKRSAVRLTTVLIMLAALSLSVMASDPPGWLRQAASVKVPEYDKDVTAVVLRKEEEVSVNSDGRLTSIQRYAIKILNEEGRRRAIARARYLTSASKVNDFDGWVIFPDGTDKDYGKKETLDIIADPDDVYNEGRVKVIDAVRDVDVGCVFGFEAETESPSLFYQDIWHFQTSLPTLYSRYILNLPDDWKASSITFNHAEVKPAVNGTRYVWELRDLQPIKLEPLSPSVTNIVPFMAVNFGPDDPERSHNRTFSKWSDVSVWASALYDPQAVVDDSVAAKARELTAGAETELDKIKAIGAFVQNLQYISIDIGVAYGAGYKPRPSNVVLARGYGDCKDKANLMRALLKAVGIDAYPIAIYLGDRTFVKAKWVSPRQFNHCIIAIVVGKDTSAPTIVETESLGRLLIFDATDDLTPVGDLPSDLQGSYGLVVAGPKGDLVEMPTTAPEMNSMDRQVELSLRSDGAISGTITESSKGQSSRDERMRFRRLSKADYRKMIERWLASGATAAKLIELDPEDKQAEASFDLKVEFEAPGYGQLMQNRLLIFKPAVVSRLRNSYLTEKDRVHPVEMDSNAFSEKAVFELPKGFDVDELPDPVKLDTAFGSYSTSYEVKDSTLIFTRKMITKRIVVPSEEYQEVFDFYKKIIDAEQSPVVLIRN